MILKFGNKLLKLGNKLLSFGEPKWNLSKFYSIPEVYASLNEGDKISFVIRHAERDADDHGTEGKLNANGELQATALGTLLQGGIAAKNDIALYATSVYRCKQTASLIAKGRGDTVPGVDDFMDVALASDLLRGHAYTITEGSNSWDDLSRYAYGVEYEGEYKDQKTISDSIVEYATPKDTDKTLNIYISHDFCMLPLVAYESNRKIDMKFYEAGGSQWETGKWINYLTGIAVIKRASGEIEIVNVTGLLTGVTNSGSNQQGQPPLS